MSIDIGSVCLFLLITLNQCETNGFKLRQLNQDLFERLLTGLEKAYDFYETEYQDVNLDGIYGLRVSEGALLKILQEQKTGKLNLKESLAKRISILVGKASKSAEKSLPHLKQYSPLYFKKFETTIVEPWKNFKTFKKLDYSLYIPVNKRSDISFDEDTSDACMTQMTGTGKKNAKPCQLTDQCWNLMMSKGASGYTLTHQALFLLIGETKGCKNVLEEKLRSTGSKLSLEKVYDRICASMYPQMVEKEKENSNSQYERDLYMEQAMVCGSMGYYEFLSVDRLKKILKWQKKSGCYGSDDEDDYKRTTVYNHDKSKKTFINDLDNEGLYDDLKGYDFKPAANSRKLTSMRTMRSLLVEKALNGGCMSHITGVATGLLGVYLRWAVHLTYSSQDSPQPNQHHHIFMRKIMQNQPQLVEEINQETHKQRSYSMNNLILVLLVILFVLIVHRLVVRIVTRTGKSGLNLLRKTKLFVAFKKQHI